MAIVLDFHRRCRFLCAASHCRLRRSAPGPINTGAFLGRCCASKRALLIIALVGLLEEYESGNC